ncbi:MAG: glycosyl transferase family 2 [Bacilli bacterium]|nr:glycosyl transferase family 2 [Bacilli bacterium]
MKIIVYAICKNEEKNVKEWYESMKEADEIYVLDTGSTDNTMKLFKECSKVKISQKIITPWRFDEARNESLSRTCDDADLYVSTDLDDRFIKGWRNIIESKWKPGINKIRYPYVLKFNPDGTFARFLNVGKIHTKDFKWIYPIHEVLECSGKVSELEIPELVLSTTLESGHKEYLDLLKLAVKEYPGNLRHQFLLAREYYLNGQNETAIKEFKKYLKTATWDQEKSVSMRFMARCYKNLDDMDNAVLWYKNAARETPNVREAYYELGELYFKQKNYLESKVWLDEALSIETQNKYYINDEKPWNGSIYDMLAYCNYSLKRYKEAYSHALTAKKYFPNDKRIEKNINVYKHYADKE